MRTRITAVARTPPCHAGLVPEEPCRLAQVAGVRRPISPTSYVEAGETAVVIALEIVAGWCAISAVAAFTLGPLLRGMQNLADRHEAPALQEDRTAA